MIICISAELSGGTPETTCPSAAPRGRHLVPAPHAVPTLAQHRPLPTAAASSPLNLDQILFDSLMSEAHEGRGPA